LDVALPPQANFAFTANRQQVTNTVNQLGSRPMMGSTNLSAGLDLAVRQLTGTNAGSLSSKVVVLFTDGMWNDGRNPLLAAQDARNAGVTVHIVTMLTADQADLRQAAQLTGGRYYNAANASQLASAFREIAKSLQVVLID
jgi:Mg-chelatase subunit ChlD